ncbi:MAG: peptide ABC transporter substrate-binding protein [Acetobacteraceae bacterium SCN 69-10]|nr:MAG: peptide ABC transporter substrate-binding protein [Acetobacteraceae bacterium SCN 69-10]OJY65306.1 MAG: peptide ABC transporter substrate-binding protein [Rhodospirillales bacterium 70-18]
MTFFGNLTRFATACAVVTGVAASVAAMAAEPKHGGTIKIYQRDNPPSASIHEEATYSVNVPFMAVFNNLVLYKQDVPQNSMSDIVPELATSWKWSGDYKTLTFMLRKGVKWHDGKPFTAQDVKCTFDMLKGTSANKFRKNPRKAWYDNLENVSVENDFQATFHLGHPQPAMLALLASGYSPIYPCHVSARDMRVHPIGTGPFKFVEFKQNEDIKLVRNRDYWKKDRPYLDAIEYPIITNRSTAMLAFVAGKVDMTFPTEVTPPIQRDIAKQDPTAVCVSAPTNVSTNLIVNRDAAPFNEPDIRMAMALAIDRKAFVDILSEGQNKIGGTMLPAPDGVWGMPDDMLRKMPGYDPDVAKNREQARALMAKHGYGPDKHLKVKVSTRNIAQYRDAAVILIDHLKTIWMDGELEEVESSNWFAKVARKDYAVGLNLTGNAVDDPDQAFFENYSCKSERNYTGYCNPALEKLFEAQSQELDQAKRKQMVWDIDFKLQEDVARPIIFHSTQATCWKPYVHGFSPMVNSSYNGFRFEDLWVDK